MCDCVLACLFGWSISFALSSGFIFILLALILSIIKIVQISMFVDSRAYRVSNAPEILVYSRPGSEDL